MGNSISKYLFGLLVAGCGFGLTACDKPGEALDDRKRRENEQEIEQYLDQNKLRANAQRTSIGNLYYIMTKAAPDGQKPQVGDQVQYHYIARRLDNLIVDSTDIAANKPLAAVFAGDQTTGVSAGLYAGINQLREGEEAILLVPAYLDTGRPGGTLLLPKYSPVRYDLRIVSVRNGEEQINDYIRAKNINVTQKQDNGLRVVVTQARPDSAQITTGKAVTLKYTGKLLNDQLFDTGTISVNIGEGRVVKGFEEGLQKLRAGEKATLIFPSAIGYATQRQPSKGSGYAAIPAYSPLVFEIEVQSVK